jgi:hypothetical protein
MRALAAWLALSFFTSHALAAACCGGGFALPSLISSDDQFQGSVTYIYGRVIDDVLPDGKWVKYQVADQTDTLKLDAAHLIADRWQIGASVPVIYRSHSDAQGSSSRTGFGDSAINLGYEVLPDWSYSTWRPKGLVFLQLTAPTGKSVYEDTDVRGASITGRGFWALGAGLLFTKSWGTLYDAQVSGDVHRSFNREVNNQAAGGVLHVHPGWGESLTAGVGLNYRNVRLGLNLGLNYEDPVNVSGAASSTGGLQRFETASAIASYMFSDALALSFSYSDQTLFGSPLNTVLSRTFGLVLQFRQPR